MSDNALAKKLLIKPGYTVAVLNAPAGYRDTLILPSGAKFSEKPSAATADFVQLFAKDQRELAKVAPSALKALKENGVLWVTFPKGSSKVQSDLTRDRGWETMAAAGFDGVSLVSIDETWSAMRFRRRELVKSKK